jgi:exonuclease III
VGEMGETQRFLTLNVNGMRGMNCRRELFSTIMTAGSDVIALQETHQEADAHMGTQQESLRQMPERGAALRMA